MAAIDKRRHERHAKRIKLRYRAGSKDKWHPAFTQDLSVSGIFITSNTIPIIPEIEIELANNEGTIIVKGTVIRGKKVPPRLRRMVQGGFAVKLRDVPEAWYQICLDLAQKGK